MSRGAPRIAELGLGIIVGDRDACVLKQVQADRAIHIWRPDTHPKNSCFHGVPPTPRDSLYSLYYEYRDGESLTKAGTDLDSLIEFCKGTDRLFIHCAAGQTRSPTLAVLALRVRGMCIGEAVGVVMQGIWESYKVVTNICHDPMKDIWEKLG
ncbi:MAG: hypothetical protein UY48_C0003G0104 [Candidatus Gottesmanbacteria bacterium GW2011_GWB1_49_7]|uniref:Tyrosine specific protein phosphatases domain-containing protein n=1 Tax=Candidatus Gottesmanbacteria bacterium GW2011_GWB1_49_7 TaxID=1618448 RepID=A0A0G1YE98_9BACT|nr:MAG: hypothetical protein UY48_C0003G0104 [Candidatus Gottesmanbacteria bacterium GW2011_GWB1_49_7]